MGCVLSGDDGQAIASYAQAVGFRAYEYCEAQLLVEEVMECRYLYAGGHHWWLTV